MKENKAFIIPFITKKQLKSRQALHIIFLKPNTKYVERPQSSISMNPSLMFPLFQKYQSHGQNQQKVNSVVYHSCPSGLASRLALTFLRHLN